MSQENVVVAPGRWPLLGHLFPLARSRMAFLTSLNSCGGLVEVRLGTQRAYVVTDPDLLHRMLVTDAYSFDKGRMFEKARRFIGNGLATASTETHRSHRRMLQPAFHHQRIAEYIGKMWQLTEENTRQWEPGQTIDIIKATDELAMDIVAKLLFSSNIGKRAAEEVHNSVPIIIRGTLVRGLIPPLLGWLPLPDNQRYTAAMSGMKHAIAEVVTGYRAEGADHGDLLSLIIAARDEQTGRQLNDHEIHDEVMTFLLGGVESPAAALAWVFHELAQHPDVERQLHAEIDTVVVRSPPTSEDISRLRYTNRVITEVLRLYSSTLLMRRVIHPVELGGVRLPVGTELIFSPYAVHRDPRWYPDPDRFDPDRWLPERAADIPRGAYIPFGAGARQCIANSFAMTEMAVVIAGIAARWRLDPIPGQRVRAVAHAAVHPSRLTMVCQPRARTSHP